MARGEDWSEREVRAAVRSYLEMFERELNDQPYNKAEHRRVLLPKLEGRSEGSVERKHMNISAALNQLGFPSIDGYKPLGNLQSLLLDVLAEELARRPDIPRRVEAVVEASPPPAIPTTEEILRLLVDRPSQPGRGVGISNWPASMADPEPRWRTSKVNYLERETRNRDLGLAGEEFALRFEQAQLLAAGQERLAAEVEHVSQTRGDGLGFDILSFEPDGQERFVEVKTTNFSKDTPFFASRNEVAFSEREASGYRLSRVFGFRSAPRLFVVPGPLTESCRLEAETFRVQVGG
jgi:hypothetical protein